MRIDLRVRWSAVVLASALAGSVLMADDQDKPVKPDNTKVNQRDRGPAKVTADQQKNNKTDIEISRHVRRALMDDKTLSTYAHNVKVVTMHGVVTLKGPVRTEEERRMVTAKAVEIAGAANVKDELSIAPKKDTSADRSASPDQNTSEHGKKKSR